MKEWKKRKPNKVEDEGRQEAGGVRGSRRFRRSFIILLGSSAHATIVMSARPFAQVMLKPSGDKTDRHFFSFYLIISLFCFSTSIKY